MRTPLSTSVASARWIRPQATSGVSGDPKIGKSTEITTQPQYDQGNTTVTLAAGGGPQVRRSLFAPAIMNIVVGALFAVAGIGFGLAVLTDSTAGIGLIVAGLVAATGCFSTAVCCLKARSHVMGDQLVLRAVTRAHQCSKAIAWSIALVGALATIFEIVMLVGGMGTPVLVLSLVLLFGALGTMLTSVARLARLAALDSTRS